MAEAQNVTTGVVLAVDVGNTTTSLGLFEGGGHASDEPTCTWELSTPQRLTVDEVALRMRQVMGEPPTGEVMGAILSCVVPALSDVWERALGRLGRCRPYVVGPGLRTGLPMRYRDPSEIGPDRIADAVAARERHGTPVIAVDLGTTLNLEVVGRDGSFLGGLIAPGLAAGAQSLSQHAARLPMIELAVPEAAIGRSTREAMLAGVVLGEVARIDGLLDRVFAELGEDAPIVLTGEGATRVAKLVSHDVIVDATLALRGLHQLYLLNARR